ncbi:hypothetical protein GGR56DRAFT_646648 [Xylariaceae sp. FL0804]|nr:hypothetical protein GGR56DRAFT_646648 [Xylariaceae sp. FL0804]
MGLDVPAGTPDRGYGVEVMCIFLIIVVTLALAGRVAAKFVTKQYWWWDDLFAILSYPIQIALLATILAWRSIGLGLHADVVAAHDPEYLLQGAKYLYIAIFFFDSSISFPKLSALFFYGRIFRSNNRGFRVHLKVVGGLVVGWMLATLFSTLFECIPIAKAWDATLPGHCIQTFPWYLATAALSVLVDCYILLLPLPMIWTLNVSLRRRVYLLVTFLLAYSVIVLSVGRLVTTVEVIPTVANDLTWNFPTYVYWACLEGSVSFVSISVPNIFGLVKSVTSSSRCGGLRRIKSTSNHTEGAVSGGNNTTARRTQIARTSPADFERLVSRRGSLSSGDDGQEMIAGAKPMSVDRGDAILMDGIRVETKISVSRAEGTVGQTTTRW